MSCGETARILQGGRAASVQETRQRRLIESREGFDAQEEKREYLSPPLSARGHDAIVLFS